MTKAEAYFHEIAAGLPDAKEGKMFGALCIKAPNGKAAAMFKGDAMIFKLPAEAEREVLSLDGTGIFDPMGGRPMRGWVEVPFVYAERWPDWARQALAYVREF